MLMMLSVHMGSTSGNLDENSIFYLMSRGLSQKQSKQLLIEGFILDVIEKIIPKLVLVIKKLTGIDNDAFNNIKKEFPIFNEKVHNNDLVYLDSAKLLSKTLIGNKQNL